MEKRNLTDLLNQRDISIRLDEIFDTSKASSGGERDLNFLQYLMDQRLLIRRELVLKRKMIGINEEYFSGRYKKTRFESDRHFTCRAVIQEELKSLGINTMNSIDIGNMSILRENCNYDIVTEDFSTIINIGLTPARNYFRGLTDVRIQDFMLTNFFDDYIDDIIFSTFSRTDDAAFLNMVLDYENGFKTYSPSGTDESMEQELMDQSFLNREFF